MSSETLTNYLKDAGPIGPALWAFDVTTQSLAGIEVVQDHEIATAPETGTISMFLLLGSLIVIPIAALLAMILFFPH